MSRVVWLAAILAVAPGLSRAQELPPAATEYLLGNDHGLRIAARVRSEASLGDDDWFQIEIANSGPAGIITSERIDARADSDSSFNSASLLYSLMLGNPIGAPGSRSTRSEIPPGTHVTRDPGAIAANHLGFVSTPIHVIVHVKIELQLADGRSFSMPAPQSIAFRWKPPTAPALGRLSAQAVDLLQRSVSGRPDLTLPEQELLRTLLFQPETSRTVPFELALASAKKRQIDGGFNAPGLPLLLTRWKDDPRLIDFYVDALVTRGPEALSDLAVSMGTPWDQSLVEPVVRLVESAYTLPPNQSFVTLDRGISLLDRHYETWSGDSSIAPRLSRAILTESWDLIPNGRYNWFELLGHTHDRGMIPVLRPFLDDKTIDQFTSLSSNMPSGVTPMRNSELAANAICRLLGEPIMFDPWHRAKVSGGRPYPEWTEWDGRIQALKERLQAR